MRNTYLILLFSICFQSCEAQDDYESENNNQLTNIVEGLNTDVKKLTVMQWYVGHFSEGRSPKSAITDDNYQAKLDEFLSVVGNDDIDIVSFSEYSVYFADTQAHPQDETQKLLNSFPIFYLGNNGKIRHYSLNAFFSKKYIEQPQTIEYVSNVNADMGRNGIVVAPDYYYVKSCIDINNKAIKFIATHLAFSKTDSSIVVNQIKELIEECVNDEYVIITGDFNVNSPSLYNRFRQNGFVLANCGDFGNFLTYPANIPSKMIDNIVVKGLTIDNVRTVKTKLSDHLPIVCDILLDN